MLGILRNSGLVKYSKINAYNSFSRRLNEKTHNHTSEFTRGIHQHDEYENHIK